MVQPHHMEKVYDYSLKFLLVGDSDVGKEEILGGLVDCSHTPHSLYSSKGTDYKATIITIDGRRVKLHLWDTSGLSVCLHNFLYQHFL